MDVEYIFVVIAIILALILLYFGFIHFIKNKRLDQEMKSTLPIEELNEKNAEAMMERSDEKRTYTVDEIQDILSISRPTAYNLVKKNLFHT